MVDLEQLEVCTSNLPYEEYKVLSSDGETEYSVIVVEPTDHPNDYICECEGFEFRGTCRHQQEVAEMICTWTARDEEQVEADICPRCGRETDFITVINAKL